MKNFFIPLLMTLVITCTSAFADQGDNIDWTGWRGPHRNGVVKNANWPDSLDASTLVKRWTVKLGPSYSGPVITGDTVFVTETKEKKFECVHAFDRSTGEKKWTAQWEGAIKVPFFARANGDWIRSTPAFDDGKLYVGGIRDVLVCLDANTGRQIWKINFVDKFDSPVPSFGFVCSPLVDGDFIYVQAGSGFCKIDKKTGDVLWRTLADEGGMNGSVFSSPSFGTINGKRQVLVQMREAIHGIDPESGKVLWSQPVRSFRGMNILTPTVYNNGVFLSTYGGTTQMLNFSESNGKTSVGQKWEVGKQGYMSSPVIVDGHAYLNMKNQTIACFDLNEGKLKWSSPRFGKYASLVTNEDKILVLDESGALMLIKADPEKFNLLSERKLGDNTWAHLGIRGDQIFVRELNAITVYDWKPPTQ